jgi:hypothetical protein
LTTLSLANNLLTSPSTVTDICRSVTSLQVLFLQGNHFTGTGWPSTLLSTLQSLSVLDLSDCGIAGKVPSNLPASLRACSISGGRNNLTCPLPRSPAACFNENTCQCPAGQFFVDGDCRVCDPGTIRRDLLLPPRVDLST